MDWAMKGKSYLQRRTCALVGIDPRMYRRASKRPTDTKLRTRMKQLASERRRFGYRRLDILLRREGWEMNWKKIYRLYREEGLTVRKRGGGKRAIGTRAPMTIPQGPNQRWSLDFVSDALADAAGSASSASSTTSAGNAWQPWSIHRCPDTASTVNWIGLPRCAASPAWWSATTAPSGRRTPCSNGRKTARSSGITSRRESRCRTAWWGASMDACATSA